MIQSPILTVDVTNPLGLTVGDRVSSSDPNSPAFQWRGKIIKMHPTNLDLCYVDYSERASKLKLKETVITAWVINLRRADETAEVTATTPKKQPVTPITLEDAKRAKSSLLEVKDSDSNLDEFTGCQLEVRSIVTGRLKFRGELVAFDDEKGWLATIRMADGELVADFRECFVI
jgi:hypothetical protein